MLPNYQEIFPFSSSTKDTSILIEEEFDVETLNVRLRSNINKKKQVTVFSR